MNPQLSYFDFDSPSTMLRYELGSMMPLCGEVLRKHMVENDRCPELRGESRDKRSAERGSFPADFQ